MATEILNPLSSVRKDIKVKILENGLKRNRNFFLKMFHIKIKGFTDIKKAPNQLIMKEFTRMEIYEDIQTSKELLKLWFEGMKELQEFVRKLLIENNYEPIDHDFNVDQYKFNALHEKDVFCEEKSGQSYFQPTGMALNDYDPEEITLMAFLLGWHIDKNSQPEKNDNNTGLTIILDKILIFEKDLNECHSLIKLIQPKISKGEVEAEENTKLINYFNKINCDLDEIKKDLTNLSTTKGYNEIIFDISNITSKRNALDILDKIKILEERRGEIAEKFEDIENMILCGKKIKHKGNIVYQPIIACNEAIDRLCQEIEISKTSNSNLDISSIALKAQPIADFVEIAKNCPNNSLDPERLEHLLEVVKCNFGDVMKEYLFKKLYYEDDIPKSNQTEKLIKNKPEILEEVNASVINEKFEESENNLIASESIISNEPEIKPEIHTQSIDQSEKIEIETPVEDKEIPSKQTIVEKPIINITEKVIFEEVEPSLQAESIPDVFDKFSKDSVNPEFDSLFTKTSLELTNIILDPDNQNVENDKNKLGLLIWKLIENNPDIAFHISTIVEKENLDSDTWYVPSKIIRTLILSQAIKYERRVISSQLKSDFGFCNDVLILEQDQITNLAFRIILLASTCRPYLLAPDSEANQILYNLKINEYPKLQELINIMSKFRASIPLDIDLLRKHQAEIDWEENAQSFTASIENWVETSRAKTYRKSHVINQVWRTWHESKNYIGAIVKLIGNQNYSEIAYIRDFLEGLSEHDKLQSEIERTLRILHPKQPKIKIEPKAFDWLHERIIDFEDLLTNWIEIQSSNPVRKNNYYDQEIRTLYDDIEGIKEGLISTTDTILLDKSIHFKIKIAIQVFRKSFDNLLTLLQGDDKISEELEEKILLNSILLRMPGLRLNTNWTPKKLDASDLKKILTIITELNVSWETIFERQLESKNYITTGWLLMLFKKCSIALDANSMEKENLHMTAVRNEELVYYIRKVENQIENGVALGFLTDIVRNSLVGELNSIKSILELNERFNYLDEIEKIEDVKSKIESEKQKMISSVIIPENIDVDSKKRIESILLKGDIYTTNELINIVNKGNPIEDFEKNSKNVFLDYYTKIIDPLYEYLDKTERKTDISKSIKERDNIDGLELAILDPSRAIEASQLYNCWHNMQGDMDFEKNVRDFFEYLGFNGVEIDKEKFGRRGEQKFLNFKCQSIKEKAICPVPEYGTLAKGHYRVLSFGRKMVMEDLVKAVTDDESRIPKIILYFNPLNLNQRKELAYYSRKQRHTFLTIDETMLLYICSVQGSRLSTLFKLALPTIFLTPYITTGSNVPLEMFYGRKPEKKKIINQYETSFLYGGRQLGKTALLKEIQKEFSDPSKGHFAIMIDLKSELSGDRTKANDFAAVLIKELRNIGLSTVPNTVPSNISTGKVLQYIKEWLEIEHERKILLFLDEADKFLEEDSKEDFRNVSRLKATMESTDRRFKVVFAGLHNVQRTTKLPNNPLAHLGEPICIGPLLDEFESQEARSLIKVPLESLGFVFETEYLINRILAQTNYYPSFIQVYCSNLLDHLYNFIDHSILDKIQIPFIITEHHVNEAFSKAKDWIKEKYKFTLGLDERYSLITHIIALGALDNILDSDENPTKGFSVSWIKDQSLYYWNDGFSNRNSYNDINTLLLEMVGLGILRKIDHDSDRYALRTNSITNFLGDRLQIEKELLRDDRKIANEFAPNIFRVEYKSKNDDKWRLKSPFTIYQYHKILEPKNSVLILRGNELLGNVFIQEFLKNKLGSDLHEFNNPNSTIEQYFDYLTETIEKREKEGILVIIITSQTPFNKDWIDLTEKKTGKLTSTDSFVHVLFELNPQRTFELLTESNVVFDEFSNLGIECIDLQPWEPKVVKEWLTDEGYRSLDFQQLEKCTGNMHLLLDEFYKDTLDKSPQYWKSKIAIMNESLLKKENARSILGKCGLTQDKELSINILSILSNDNQQYSAGDIIFFVPNPEPGGSEEIYRNLIWLTSNSIINSAGDDSWVINPFCSEVFKHCDFNS